MFGTVDTPYSERNLGSRERPPKAAARILALRPEETAATIVTGIERVKRSVIRSPQSFACCFC